MHLDRKIRTDEPSAAKSTTDTEEGVLKGKRQRRRLPKMVLSSCVALIVGMFIFSGLSFQQLRDNVTISTHAVDLLTAGRENVKTPAAEPKETLPSDFYMLLLGVDADESRRSGKEAKQFKKEQGGTFRSDSITLAHVNTETNNVTVCSFDRDIKSIIQGFEDEGYRKLNNAYELGGTETMKAEVEELTGLDIPYVAVVDMGGFDTVVDAIGGIDVDIEEPFYDDVLEEGFDEAGMQHLDGAKTVFYCRSRHPFEDGTVTRVRHQRMALQAIGKRLKECDALSLASFADAFSKNVATNMDIDQAMALVKKLGAMDWEEGFHSIATPTMGCMDGEVWFGFPIRAEWNKMLITLERNDGTEPSAKELKKAGLAKLDTDTVYAEDCGYFDEELGIA